MIAVLNDLQILNGFMYNPLHFMSLGFNLRLILEFITVLEPHVLRCCTRASFRSKKIFYTKKFLWSPICHNQIKYVYFELLVQ